MTAKEKQGFGLYFLLAFGLAWLLQVYASLLLLRDGNATAYQLLLVREHVLPAGVRAAGAKVLAASAHRHQLEAPPERQAAGIWLAAWFGPAVFTVLAAVLYFAVFPSRLDTSGSWLATAYGGAVDTGSPENRAGGDHDQLPDPERSAGGHAGTACQYDPRCGRGSRVGAAI